MSEERFQAVRVALITISAAHNVKPSKSLFSAWMIAIDNLNPDEIAETTKYCLKRRKSSFLPTPGEFLEIAEQLKAERAKEIRIAQEIAESNRHITYNPEGKKKVAEMAANIGSEMGKKKMEPPQFTIYEYADQKGNFSYAASGEIPFDLFGKEVYRFCGSHPQNIKWVHRRIEKVKKKYDNDEIRTYTAFVEKDQPGPDTEPFTIGYV